MIVRSGVTAPMHPGRVVGGASVFVSGRPGLRSANTQQYMAKTVGGDSVDQDSLPWSSSTAWVKPIVLGAITGTSAGTSSSTAHAMGRGLVTGDTTGIATGTAHLRGVKYSGGTAAGAATNLAHAMARGYINATLSIGSRPTADDVAQAVWGSLTTINQESGSMATLLRLLLALGRNKMVTDPVGGTITVYADDDSTVLLQADLWEDAAGTSPYAGSGAERRDRMT